MLNQVSMTIIVVVIALLVSLVMFMCRNGRLDGWWRRHVVDEFPYPGECFECKRSNCEGCPVQKHGK